ncbi:MAG: sigma 54-interacting transcriptional regulator, partial [Muribaculaceae bacterium]|nr:sigma 54-interacting transcriptional regulator [Muribaculaceae bacterium]
VAELPRTTQARLLRVLESGEFIKVGSSVVQKTNIRVVAATNVDMLRAVEEGRFREDLYYRLSTVQISIPPLRDRGSDIGLLARKFSADFAERWRLPSITFTEEARAAMSRYSWPGNVRQLKNVVEQIALFEAGKDVDTAVLCGYLPENATVSAPALVDRGPSYAKEREMLMGMILSMQSRIDRLEARHDEARRGMDKNTPAAVPPSNIMSDKPVNLGMVPSQVPAPRFDSDAPGYDVYDYDEPGGGFVSYSEDNDSFRSPEAPVAMSLQDREREAIREALARNNGHRKAAADELKISQRTLYRKIKEYGID